MRVCASGFIPKDVAGEKGNEAPKGEKEIKEKGMSKRMGRMRMSARTPTATAGGAALGPAREGACQVHFDDSIPHLVLVHVVGRAQRAVGCT